MRLFPAAATRRIAGATQDGKRPSAANGRTGGAAARSLTVALLAADATFAFQQTAIVPAVHDVQVSLNASPEWSAWLITIYLIVATIATPAMGRLADLHGRRRMLLTGLGVFLLGSVGAALAPDTAILLAFRAVQGIGGSVYPLTLARRLLPREQAVRVIALSAGSFGLGTLAGFAGGGLLAAAASWRWIFVVGAVLVAIGFCLVAVIVPASGEHAGGTYDWRGTLALAGAAVGSLVALTLVVPLGWASPLTAGLLATAVAAVAAWAWIETRVTHPLIDVHVLRAPPVLRANLASVALGWALFSSYLLVPHFALARPGQAGYGLGVSTAAAGLIMLPLAAGQTISGPAAGWAARRLPARAVFATGLLLMATALGWLSANPGSLPQAAAALGILGLGAGTGLQAASTVATQGVSDDVAAASSALNSTIRRVAGGIGGQVAIILLAGARAGASSGFLAIAVAYLAAAALCIGAAVTVALPGA